MNNQHLHAGEGVAAGQVAVPAGLAWKGHMQEQGPGQDDAGGDVRDCSPLPDISHSLISYKV